MPTQNEGLGAPLLAGQGEWSHTHLADIFRLQCVICRQGHGLNHPATAIQLKQDQLKAYALVAVLARQLHVLLRHLRIRQG